MEKGKVDALLGIVFGDEGKGKVVDVFTPQYDVVARFAGGPNAGHTITRLILSETVASLPRICLWQKPRNWKMPDMI